MATDEVRSTTHECPADGCSVEVPFHILACSHHWFAVSPQTRRRVNKAWRSVLAGEDDALQDYTAARAMAVHEMNR